MVAGGKGATFKLRSEGSKGEASQADAGVGRRCELSRQKE